MRAVHAAAIAAAIAAAGSVPSRTAAGQTVHRFTDRSTFTEHGDTITWVRRVDGTPGASAAADTMIFVLRSDSTVVRLRPGPPTALPPFLATHVRNIVAEARAKDRLEQRLGEPLP